MEESEQPIDASRLIGTWLLVGLVGQSPDGEVWQPYGANPVGQIMYDAAGYMSVVFMRSDRPRLADRDYLGGSADELKAAFQGFEAYAGTYTLVAAARTVTHHLRSARLPNWAGDDQVRHIQVLTDEELRLGAPRFLARGKEWSLTVRWVRAR